jgi:hypothetical protein
MRARQKPVNGGFRFKFPHHPRQRGPVVVQFRFLHPPLAVRIAEECQRNVEGLVGVVDDVRKRLSLTIRQKLVPRDARFGPAMPPSVF